MPVKYFFASCVCILFAALPFAELQAQTSLLFCGGVENGKPIGVSDRYYPDSAVTYLYAFYGTHAPLKMKKVSMELYKKNGDTFDLIGTKQSFSVKRDWEYTYLKCYFDGPGQYRVKLYDVNDNMLAEGMVIIM